MDLGISVWTGGNGRLRPLHRLYRTLAATTGAGGICRHEPAGVTGVSGRLVERMAIDDHVLGSDCAAEAGGIVRGVLRTAYPRRPRFGCGAGAVGTVYGAGPAAGSLGVGVPQGSVR